MDLGARKITWRTGLDMSWWAARVKWEGRRNICEVACAPDESWVRCKNFIFWNLPGGFVSAVPASSSAPGERGRNDFKTQLIFLSGPVLCMNRLVLENNMNTCWQKYQMYLGFNPKSSIYLINEGSRGKGECVWGRTHSQAFGSTIWRLLI